MLILFNSINHACESLNILTIFLSIARATSTTHKAGLGVFAGKLFKTDETVGRVGDAAFPTVDQNWHLSSEDGSVSKAEGDFHWLLANYDWNAPDIGCEWEAEDISVTVTGFGGKFDIDVAASVWRRVHLIYLSNSSSCTTAFHSHTLSHHA